MRRLYQAAEAAEKLVTDFFILLMLHVSFAYNLNYMYIG